MSVVAAIPGPMDVVGSAARSAGETVVETVWDAVFSVVADAVESITSALVSAINGSTPVDLAGGWWASPERQEITVLVASMSAALLAVFFLLTIIRSALAGESSVMIRAAVVDLPVAVFGSVAVAVVASLLLGIVDAASVEVLGDVDVALGRFAGSLAVADVLSRSGLLGLVFAVLYIVGALLLWLELLVRSALIYLVIVFAPLAFSARVFPAARHMSRRMVEIGIALIVSKFAIVLALAVGAAAVNASTPPPEGPAAEADLRGMLVGAAVMLTAALMPWLLLKVIPLFEAAAVAEGAARAPMRAAAVVMTTAVATTSLAKIAHNKSAAGGIQGAGGGAHGGAGTAGPSGGAPPATGGSPPRGPARVGGITAVPLGGSASTSAGERR